MKLRTIQAIVGLAAFALTVAGAVWPSRGDQALAALAASALAISLAAEPLFATPAPAGEEAVRAAISLSTVCFLTLGLSTIVAIADHWAVAILWAGACLLGGGFLGMLFGVPLQNRNGQAGGSQNLLVQTADTFSKFIAGATLAKFGSIFQRFQDASSYLAQCLQCCQVSWLDKSKGEYNSSLAGGIILYFSALGFVAGILLTRFYKLDPEGGAEPADGAGAPAAEQPPAAAQGTNSGAQPGGTSPAATV